MHPLIDLHCDTIHALEESGKGTLRDNEGLVSLAWMDKAGRVTTCFALFVDIQQGKSPWQQAKALHTRFLQEMSLDQERIVQVSSGREIIQNELHGAILSCEELHILEGNLQRIQTLASWKVRLATLTWNYENDLGFPHHTRGGLKKFGFSVVEELQANNMLVDVSHLNDEGFFDVAAIARKPFIASHSNCRSITNHSRNLSDRMIRTLADRGGVVGLTFCPSFLSEDWHTSSIESVVRHALHLKKVGGASVLALGTDYDGVTGELAMPHYDSLALLWQALQKAGFSCTELEGMWFGNALRVLS